MVAAYAEGAREAGHEVNLLLEDAEMIVLASPVCYHSFSGQLQCAINRIYALDKPKSLKKAALILSSGSNHVYCGAFYEYQQYFLNYLHLEDMRIFTAYGKENKSEESLAKLCEAGCTDFGFLHCIDSHEDLDKALAPGGVWESIKSPKGRILKRVKFPRGMEVPLLDGRRRSRGGVAAQISDNTFRGAKGRLAVYDPLFAAADIHETLIYIWKFLLEKGREFAQEFSGKHPNRQKKFLP